MVFRQSKRFDLLLQFIDLLSLEAEIGVLPRTRAEELIRFSGEELIKVVPKWRKDLDRLVEATLDGLPR